MPHGYVLDTAHWLCEVEAQDGGWGIEPNADESHKPISGEVAYALSQVAERDDRVRAKLTEMKHYFERTLDAGETPRSVVHLCWLVLGSVACGISIHDNRLTTLLELLANAHRDGWAWSLDPHSDDRREVYPTYLALLTLSHARDAGCSDGLRFEHAGIWLVGCRQPDLLWEDPASATPGERVLNSAYAILALYYAYTTADFQSNVAHSLQALSEAALDLRPDQAVVIESPSTAPALPRWHHCVIPQVVWTRLQILGMQGTLDGSPLPQLLAKCVSDMWREEDRTWLDPSRDLSAPYLAADMLRVMAAYAQETCDRLVAPELAVRMITEARKAETLAQALAQREKPPVATEGFRYPYASRHLGLSTPMYWAGSVAMAVAIVAAAAIGKHPLLSKVTAARLIILLALLVLYVPLRNRLGADTGLQRLGLVGVLATLAGVGVAFGADQIFK